MRKKKIVKSSLLAALLGASLLGLSAVPALAEDSDKIADASEMTAVEDVVEDWMVPIFADSLVDGEYDIEVKCSSAMFPVEAARLIVEGQTMTADLTMGGTGYLYVYPGTPEEALEAPESDYIPFEEDENGVHHYTVPVSALDSGIKLAAFSKNKEKWYDRTLVFLASSLPDEAFSGERMATVQSLGLADGNYTIEAQLEGGSGKASVESPALLSVQDGEGELWLVFSSDNYDYVVLDGEKYEAVPGEENSSFYIPVTGFDYNLPITVDSVALNKGREVDYTLFLDSSTLKEDKAS